MRGQVLVFLRDFLLDLAVEDPVEVPEQGQGASGGEPRWIEDPEQRVKDYRDVIDYAQTLPYVDPERIGILGVCGGGGYSIKTTIIDKRIKARDEGTDAELRVLNKHIGKGRPRKDAPADEAAVEAARKPKPPPARNHSRQERPRTSRHTKHTQVGCSQRSGRFQAESASRESPGEISDA